MYIKEKEIIHNMEDMNNNNERKELDITGIPLNAKKLLSMCKEHDWYLDACRRAVTRAHVSPEGISQRVIEFIGSLKEKDPSLAFAMSPTTLHDNTLVGPEYASYFTCDPSKAQTHFFSTTYNSCINEEGLENVLIRDNKRATGLVAKTRLMNFIKCLEFGDMKWKHPEHENTGWVIAGGLISGSLLSNEKWEEIKKKTDIDIFVYGQTVEQRRDMAMFLAEHLSKVEGFRKFKVFKSVIQVHIKDAPEIQIVCPFARSPLGVLINFDSTFIQVGYDGENFYSTPGYCFFTPRNQSLIVRYNFRFYRFLKVLKRGFLPVTDSRGHLMYPRKLLFSATWKLNFKQCNSGSWKLWVEDGAEMVNADFDLMKPDVDWEKMSFEELEKEFAPEAQTLSNGFDIYTRGVNNTLPLPEDGDTSNLYKYNVLLRNIRILPTQDEYNLASTKEDPLIVKHVDFVDDNKVYPHRKYTTWRTDKEPVRVIEGVFLFKDLDVSEKKEVPSEDENNNNEKELTGKEIYEKNQSLRDRIDFEDLHTYVKEPKNMKVIPIEELGCLMDAFAHGDTYGSSAGVIYRGDGMVKVRTVISFNPCMVFGVDDLFLHQISLDQNSNRRYNGVVHLSNLRRWIIKAHEHIDEICFSDDRDMIIAMLRESVKPEINEEGEGEKLGIKVSEFLRAIRHVTNTREFQEIANKESCLKPHAIEGLKGEMPVLFCTRLYVTRENIN